MFWLRWVASSTNEPQRKVVLTLVGLLFAVPGLPWKPIEHFESFSGQQSVTLGELHEGRTAVAFDIVNCPSTQDLMIPQGFANALYWAANLLPGSGKTAAPVCSTQGP